MSARAGDEGDGRACEPAARRRSHGRARGRRAQRARPPENPAQEPKFTNVKSRSARRGQGVCQFGVIRSKSEFYGVFLGEFSDKVTCVSTYTHYPCGNGG